MKSRLKKPSTIISIAALVVTVILAAVIWTVQAGNKDVTVPFSSVEKIIASQDGKTVAVQEYKNGKLLITAPDGEYISHVPPNSDMVDKLVETYNIQYTFAATGPYTPWILGGIVLLFIAIGIYLFKSGKGGMGATNTMKQSVSKPKALPSISLEDVGGIQEEMKEEIMQTLSILKEPERSLKMGIKPPKGILLYGPPGTGKTLLAQAIAKEMGATFFSTSGSGFNELFVGVGASRVRNLFQNARKHSPAVVFIDEVDALAGRRKQHGGEESEKTLTELLVQLDGGHSNDGILFIAATNRKDMLDEAFLRPGRIDFSFNVPLPDTKGRREIINIHTKNRLLAEDVMTTLGDLAESTSGFSGADLHSLFETASRRAVRNGQEIISKDDLDYALDRTILGTTTRALQDPGTKQRVAIHEAGHALVAALTKPGSVRKVTIIPRGEALGYVAPIQKELHLSTTSELLDQVAMILAGGVSERMILGEHSIGVSGDVKQAKHIIEQMVDTGLLDNGFELTFNKGQKEAKMQDLFQKALERCELIIANHQPQFETLVEALLEKETLEGSEVQEIVGELKSEMVIA
ncbi:ATP-binding protein [Cytobacillus firmus]|uniref:AAA family ATPase n=1 Tax=Cytobacillus firmus TaxID=1399 RepID=UPI00077C1B93|nr:AAA family ATPase [Cytobacillus firmus]MBG9542169.1 ATP-binding protein [Cytobacillus firmus]MBG9547188.1 ATP-binding protein [Cytobacillus firmus]MBG9553810.1 ATP-binding protein [Cytobacillus firmus]MBG9557610.1 ATP-binding protein [Cytobacillus firmus]MBG9573808.1 ATP-binding protein [Cytobacillus firmus]